MAQVFGTHSPDAIARHDVGSVTGPLRILRLQQARDAARGRLLTLGAGLFAAGALFFTARNYVLARRIFQLTEQGQVTDRYTRAIEQLGSDKLDVRIGAIYALERIARDSARDHATVMQVLAAFIREHSRMDDLPGEPAADKPEIRPSPDVQSALSVISRRDPAHDIGPIDLSAADLSGADLSHAKLARANLSRARLSGALLTRANLSDALLFDAIAAEAHFAHTNLSGTNLIRADLSGAHFPGANLSGAKLNEANLTCGDFNGAVLVGAELSEAKLTGAILLFADLSGAQLLFADLSRAKLSGVNWSDANLALAIFSEDAPVPEGWVRNADSGRLEQATAEARGREAST